MIWAYRGNGKVYPDRCEDAFHFQVDLCNWRIFVCAPLTMRWNAVNQNRKLVEPSCNYKFLFDVRILVFRLNTNGDISCTGIYENSNRLPECQSVCGIYMRQRSLVVAKKNMFSGEHICMRFSDFVLSLLLVWYYSERTVSVFLVIFIKILLKIRFYSVRLWCKTFQNRHSCCHNAIWIFLNYRNCIVIAF